MKTRSTSRSVALVTTIALTACGDALLTAQDRGDGVIGVHGMIRNPDGSAPGSDYQVAVIYFTTRIQITPPFDLPDEIETEVIPVSTVGFSPAAFDLQLTKAPTAYPWETDFATSSVATGNVYAAFSTTNAPDAVRIGLVAIGPADELAAFPARIARDVFTRSTGADLAPYLRNTTVTGYQVIYAQGAGPGDVVYPTYGSFGSSQSAPGTRMDGIPISNGFTLIDARKFYEATIWQECSSSLLEPLYDQRRFDACIVDNRELVDCLLDCSSPTCQQACEAAFPDQVDQDRCLSQAAAPALEATCGPVASPRPYLVEVVNAGASLSIVLGDDDVTTGLWTLQLLGL